MGLEQSAEGFPAQDIGKSDVLAEVLVNPALRQQYRQQRLDVFLARLKAGLEAHMGTDEIARQDIEVLARALSGLVLGLGILRILGDSLLQPENPKMDLLVETISKFVITGITGEN
jgi:hypothetical protein